MNKEKAMTLGVQLKSIMEKEGISGYRISQETGIGQSYVSKVLYDKANPTYSTLKRILKVLGYQICFEKISQRKEVKRRKSKQSKKRR
jgi:transcriptional regulator with XRE-family HTH domain